MPSFPYTPFPFNVTPASPLLELSSVSSNASQGWVPSCLSPDCVPTAVWSTRSVGAELSLQFWGWDAALDGSVKGNISVEAFRDGMRVPWDPSKGVLLSSLGGATDQLYLHNITLKVVDTFSDAELTVTQARINGSSFADAVMDVDSWMLPSDDNLLRYTGFVQQTSAAKAGSSTTYISSQPGDKASMQFNASTLLIHGPCGPTNGLMKVSIDGRESTVNTSKPVASNDCLLFQAWAFPSSFYHQLLIENVDGATLGIDRLEFFRLRKFGTVSPESNERAKTAVISITIVLGVLLCLGGLIMFFNKSKKGGKVGRAFKLFCS
ncbi:hypothetical protein RSOLAG1IB_09616 [Rhizoctonia solani AG-1 IB]|uniref:P12 domain-containing protein n=1 Tax=Thanatephorus cucumeris (strain AG1-IB / isolate 7/3/14) TaxID=1108050 RepID=M5C7C9_THACB|nr:hypothetical protein BN14_09319 [Rhizoctonia solani AG-1 IB]CEL60410.1 hypothetical protein RSOLAG1IB_09616 [Rhizoctonia solani AG-1 IB]